MTRMCVRHTDSSVIRFIQTWHAFSVEWLILSRWSVVREKPQDRIPLERERVSYTRENDTRESVMHELSRRIWMRHITDESLFIACMNIHTYTYMAHMNEAYYTWVMCVLDRMVCRARERGSYTMTHLSYAFSCVTWLFCDMADLFFLFSSARDSARESAILYDSACDWECVCSCKRAGERGRASTRERGSGKARARERKCMCVCNICRCRIAGE